MKERDFNRVLIERCRKGDRQAQFRLYRMYSKAMYNICVRMVGNEMDAEDLLQNSFLDVFQNLKSYNFKATPGAWIKRIVVNNCINFLRKRKLHFEEIDEQRMDAPEKEPELEPARINVPEINRAVNLLPDGYRAVFSLYAMEGYDHSEIAEILNVSEATSKSQYSRARKKLKEIILRNSSRASLIS